MVLAEKLIGHRLDLTWEHHLITADSLWLVGVRSKQGAVNGIELGFLGELLRAVADTVVHLRDEDVSPHSENPCSEIR